MVFLVVVLILLAVTVVVGLVVSDMTRGRGIKVQCGGGTAGDDTGSPQGTACQRQGPMRHVTAVWGKGRYKGQRSSGAVVICLAGPVTDGPSHRGERHT